MVYISKHISYDEATATSTGLTNVPNETEVANMQTVGQKVFDRVRDHFGKPIGVSSFFRCDKVNRKVGGAATSQHLAGEAIDMDGDKYGVSNKEIFNYIKEHLDFDQLIWEFGDNNKPDWVHVSYRRTTNRREILQAYKENGKTKYRPYRN